MKKIILLAAAFISLSSMAQNTGIGISNPDTKLQVDSSLRIGKNQILDYGQLNINLLKFGDGDYTSIGEQERDDRMVLRAGGFSFRNGKVGIGIDSAREALDVNGAVIVGPAINNNAGTLRYNSSKNDLEFRDNSRWNSLKNVYFTKEAYNLSSSLRNVPVDFTETDVTVPEAGVYLINYFVDAYNTFYLAGEASTNPPDDKIVYYTYAYLSNKTSGADYQQNKIDFLDTQSDANGPARFYIYQLPAHQVSGVTVKVLNANDKIGIKLRQTTAANGTGEMRIRASEIVLVRLY